MRRQGFEVGAWRIIPESDYPRSGFLSQVELWLVGWLKQVGQSSLSIGQDKFMLLFWRRRRAYQERVRLEVEALIRRHGEAAYAVVRSRRIESLRQQNSAEHRFWCAVARIVAHRTGREIGVDVATRYVSFYE